MNVSESIVCWLDDASIPVVTYRRVALHHNIEFEEAQTAMANLVEQQEDKRYDVVYWATVKVDDMENNNNDVFNMLVHGGEVDAVKKEYTEVKINHVYAIVQKMKKQDSEMSDLDYDRMEQMIFNADNELRTRSLDKAAKLRAVLNTQVVKKGCASTTTTSSPTRTSTTAARSEDKRGPSATTNSTTADVAAGKTATKKSQTQSSNAPSKDDHVCNDTRKNIKTDKKAEIDVDDKVKTSKAAKTSHSRGTGRNVLLNMFANAKKKVKTEEKKEDIKKVKEESASNERKIESGEKKVEKESRNEGLSKKRSASSSSRCSITSKKGKDAKRKRIQVLSDSSSEDEKDEDDDSHQQEMDEAPPQASLIESDEKDKDDEDMAVDKSDKENTEHDETIAGSDQDDVIPPTPSSSCTKLSRRRVHRLVTKTYVDSKGFMVTRKEMQSEDEEENDQEPKSILEDAKEEKKAKDTDQKNTKTSKNEDEELLKKKKIISQGHKSKQASITNFFIKQKV